MLHATFLGGVLHATFLLCPPSHSRHLPLLALQHWFEMIKMLSNKAVGDLTERQVAEPLLSYFSYGMLRPAHGVCQVSTVSWRWPGGKRGMMLSIAAHQAPPGGHSPLPERVAFQRACGTSQVRRFLLICCSSPDQSAVPCQYFNRCGPQAVTMMPKVLVGTRTNDDKASSEATALRSVPGLAADRFKVGCVVGGGGGPIRAGMQQR